MAETFEAVSHTLVNALAVNSGVVCDGAKPSCAAKIASAIEAGLLGYEMYRHHSSSAAVRGSSPRAWRTPSAISHASPEGMTDGSGDHRDHDRLLLIDNQATVSVNDDGKHVIIMIKAAIQHGKKDDYR
ncbi:MAG: L-serine ammonia-lyase, iron-sulfur-dependent, subunit alpha [Merdibacter sp.]